MVRVSGLVVGCGLVVLAALPLHAVAGSGQISQAQKPKVIDETPATVVFRVNAYTVKNEKAVTLCTNFADVVRKRDIPVVVNRAPFEASLKDANSSHAIKLQSAPTMRTLMGMPACITSTDGKDQFAVRAQADLVDGKIQYRVMGSALLFDAEDKTNPFWSDAHDGPLEMKAGQTIAMYCNGAKGKPGVLITFEPVFDSSLKLKP